MKEDRYEVNEMLRFLKDKIPIILDIENEKLRYDTDNIYFKIYKYIYDSEQEKEGIINEKRDRKTQ